MNFCNLLFNFLNCVPLLLILCILKYYFKEVQHTVSS